MNKFSSYFNKKPFIIAGPCSAESPEQLDNTISGIKKTGVDIIRAGIWKPRSRPDTFEGAGVEALKWLQEAKHQHNVKVAVEVANPLHVEQALRHEMDILWIGARTTVNPFAVQELAEALRGADKPVLIKNPINPDLALWIGAIERVLKAGVKETAAIHRGFSSFQPGKYRNSPVWQIPIELKSQLPEILLFCDPSHISGNREMIFEVSQTALDFDYDGLMIEVHQDPDNALSDAKQQITPAALDEMLKKLQLRKHVIPGSNQVNNLQHLREQIDEVDRDLLEVLARRMKVVNEIGKYKKHNNITIFQLERWNEIINTRPAWAEKLGFSKKLAEDIFKAIHAESLKVQTEIYNKND